MDMVRAGMGITTAPRSLARDGVVAVPLTDYDFRRTLALIHERIGYNLLTVDRAAGLGEIFRAVKCWPPAVLGIPWWRVGALAVLGDSVRRFYESRKN